MYRHIVYPAQMETQSLGYLRVRTTTQNLLPIEDVTIRIYSPSSPDRVIEEFKTNNEGLTDMISLPTPPINYSLEPSSIQPYSNFDMQISAAGFDQFM